MNDEYQQSTGSAVVHFPSAQPVAQPANAAPQPLPFGLSPAPVRRRRISPPIDLGVYDANYAGWQVVFDLDVGLDAYEKLAAAQDATGGVESLKLMREWMSEVLVAWNFPVVDFNGVATPMAQPREGGAKDCPPSILSSIASAFGDAIAPDKSNA